MVGGGGGAAVEVVTLGLAEVDVGLRGPAAEAGEPATGQQEVVGAAALDPLGHGQAESALLPDVVAGGIDPRAEPIPLGEQRFVRDLHGRAAGHRVMIEGQ